MAVAAPPAPQSVAEVSVSKGIPKNTLQKSFSISAGSQPVTAVLTSYADRMFLTLSDRKKLGTLIMAERRERVDGSAAFDVQTVLGKRDIDWHDLLARQLVQVVAEKFSRPLLLSLAMADLEEEQAFALGTDVTAWLNALQ